MSFASLEYRDDLRKPLESRNERARVVGCADHGELVGELAEPPSLPCYLAPELGRERPGQRQAAAERQPARCLRLSLERGSDSRLRHRSDAGHISQAPACNSISEVDRRT